MALVFKLLACGLLSFSDMFSKNDNNCSAVVSVLLSSFTLTVFVSMIWVFELPLFSLTVLFVVELSFVVSSFVVLSLTVLFAVEISFAVLVVIWLFTFLFKLFNWLIASICFLVAAIKLFSLSVLLVAASDLCFNSLAAVTLLVTVIYSLFKLWVFKINV